MPLYTTDALVLRTYALGEADRLVVFLTRDRGKKRGVAKSRPRPRARFTRALRPAPAARALRGRARAAHGGAGGVLRERPPRTGGVELRRDDPVAAHAGHPG